MPWYILNSFNLVSNKYVLLYGIAEFIFNSTPFEFLALIMLIVLCKNNTFFVILCYFLLCTAYIALEIFF